MNAPTHLDLFSGVGGFAIAAEWAGFTTVGFAEISRRCCAVLQRLWPDVPNLGDVQTADFGAVGAVDLLTGGFPCQPFSRAGKRRGARDDRNQWPAMRRAIELIRPAWVLGENVPDIDGMELEAMLADLEGLGYRVQPLVIPACAVDAYHRRDRLWLVAHVAEKRRQRLPAQERRAHQNAAGPSSPAANLAKTRRRQLLENQARQELPGGRPASAGFRWPDPPGVCGVVHGLPDRVDRVGSLGNAIVPQVAYEILRNMRTLIH